MARSYHLFLVHYSKPVESSVSFATFAFLVVAVNAASADKLLSDLYVDDLFGAELEESFDLGMVLLQHAYVVAGPIPIPCLEDLPF